MRVVTHGGDDGLDGSVRLRLASWLADVSGLRMLES